MNINDKTLLRIIHDQKFAVIIHAGEVKSFPVENLPTIKDMWRFATVEDIRPTTKLHHVTGKIERGEGEPIVAIPHIPTTDNEKHQAYLDYRNDFLTVARFAEHYGWPEELAIKIIDEGRVIHNLANAEGELNIIDRLKITRPEIAIAVKWEEDHDYEWDGDCEDPIVDGYYPYSVDVCACTIRNGELLEGFACLCGCYSKDAGESESDINGYLTQLVEEAVAELDKQK